MLKPAAQLPLIRILEYGLAQLWLSWGVKPAGLIGHSMGENTAAALAGVMGFEDCIDLVLLRGQLFDTVPPGGMLSVPLPEADLRALVGEDLDIASVNAPALCAVSGPKARLEALQADLAAREIEAQMVPIDIAAHSRMLDPILDEFRTFLRGLTLKAPTMPILSNRSGQVLTANEATDPDYWVAQLRETVLFGACIATAADKPDRIYLEVGPGKALATLAHMNPRVKPAQVINALRHPSDPVADDAHFLATIGRLWACGYEADWAQIWGEARRNRLELPSYAFQRSRYFIEPGEGAGEGGGEAPALTRSDDMADWGYVAGWQPRYGEADPAIVADPSKAPAQDWLVFLDDAGLGARVAERLAAAGHRVVRVSSGDSFAKVDDDHYILPTEQGRAPFDALIAALGEAGRLPQRVAHFWLVTQGEPHRPGSSFFYRNVEHGFYSLMWLGQALAEADRLGDVAVTVFTNGAAQVADEALPYPEKALIAGPVGVIGREVEGSLWASVDLDLPGVVSKRWKRGVGREAQIEALAGAALEELLAPPRAYRAALRAGKRFEQTYRQAPLGEAQGAFKPGGTYLITGGLGGIGQALARDLLEEQGANVVLLGRTALPPRAEWERTLHQLWPGDPVARGIRALMALEAMGGALRYHVGDVTDIARLREIAAETREEFGTINGVIHAAGAIDDAPFATKDAASCEAVFDPKINGVRALEEVFPDGTLDLLVLFASSSTATQPAGQIDYVAAN
ncbi:MAG TPA: KR domain-containing protein, partial [Rhodobacterales bacterium]|nr:KR domain-containing protein [Rhodobacterales bacterium]